MASKMYFRTGLTGGGSDKLDGIDGAVLANDDGTIVIDAGTAYIYRLDVDSGAAESSPDVIAPDINADNKRWILQDIRLNIGSIGTAATKDLAADGGSVVENNRINDFGTNTQKINSSGAYWQSYDSGDGSTIFYRHEDSNSNAVGHFVAESLDGAGAGCLRLSKWDRYIFESGGISVGSGAVDYGIGTITAETAIYQGTNKVLDVSNLAANSGSLPEIDRNNTFSGTQYFSAIKAGDSVFNVRSGGGGSDAIDFEDAANSNADFIRCIEGGPVRFSNYEVQFLGSGITVGTPTGGDKGTGTINAGNVYENGERVGPVESGTWTPTDGSGAGLSFTSSVAEYYQSGEWMNAYANIVWPSTTNTTAARIDGLPKNPIVTATSVFPGNISYTDYGSSITILVFTDNNFFKIYDLSGNSISNADLSGSEIRFNLQYRV